MSNDLDDDDYGPCLPTEKEDGGNENELKRSLESDEKKEEVVVKKKTLAPFPETPYPDSLPFAESYECSYMHREILTHTAASNRCDFVLTGSADGVIKFWRRTTKSEDENSITTGGVTGITSRLVEFIKQYKAHMCSFADLIVSGDGELALTVGSEDELLNLFDVPSFDLINRLKLGFQPVCAAFLTSSTAADTAQTLVALADNKSNEKMPRIVICDARGSQIDDQHIIKVLGSIHRSPINLLKYNHHFACAVSCDEMGMLEYWSGPKHSFTRNPPNVKWEYKTDTDLYDLAKNKTQALSLSFTHDGKTMAVMGKDRLLRIFDFSTGRILVTIDDTLERYKRLENEVIEEDSAADIKAFKALSAMEISRRLAVERDIDCIPLHHMINRWTLIFDESDRFLFYPTMLGVQVIDVTKVRTLKRCKCVRVLGRQENIRFLSVSMLQGVPIKRGQAAALTLEQVASSNPAIEAQSAATMSLISRPLLVCSALRRNRFYLITKREAPEEDRDVFNEKPTREDALVAGTLAAASNAGSKGGVGKLASSATLHTSFGDIQFELYGKECPKAVENFTSLAKSGYYDGNIFHRGWSFCIL